MLDKARNHLIACAFRKANITSLESDPTPAEIEDAAHTLNCMLQSWNNDGFRLFKIKTGYMPFIPNTNEYSLKSQAYKSLEYSNITRIERIGATRLHVASLENVSKYQKVVVVDDISTPATTIADIVFDPATSAGTIYLTDPLMISVYHDSTVFFGTYSTATTAVQNMPGSFNTLPFTNYTAMPVVGDFVVFCFNGTWYKRKVTQVNTSEHTLNFDGDPVASGNITNAFLAYGPIIMVTNPTEDYPVTARRIVCGMLKETPKYVAIPTQTQLRTIFEVESYDLVGSKITLVESIPEDVLEELGENRIEADLQYMEEREVIWSDFASVLPVTAVDWGSITDSTDLQTDDWGNITDAASVLEDWGTLTGNAQIVDYATANNVEYVLIKNLDNNELYLLSNSGTGWALVELSVYNLTTFGLYTLNGVAYLADQTRGLFRLDTDILTPIYSIMGVEKIIEYQGKFYMLSPKVPETITRTVTVTTDFVAFGTQYTIELDDLSNPAEFKERLFIGATDTYVGDMLNFMDADVYSQNRCVIGDRLINLNTLRPCSYSYDGVKFFPMPMMLSNQTAWASKDGCAFIAVYGVLNGGVVSTQIFTANDFNPAWTPQVTVPGRVFKIFFDDTKAYFVSDVAVYSLLYNLGVEPTAESKVFCFGEQIGRPQELMNVVKYGFTNKMQLPMNALALKDFCLLPHDQVDGEPVNYCFLREAEDGKMMIWGTPNKFGEYLRFSYVEPITLLEGARSTPDFPDEYYEAVEDGLAAQLAAQYGAPADRQQILEARAKASKEDAMLHDNEDTSYNIVPNERWG